MNADVVSKVKEIVSSCVLENGWAEMAAVGVIMQSQGINFKDEGYKRLKGFFEALKDTFVLSSDIKTHLPVIRLIDREIKPVEKKVSLSKQDKVIHLTQWANINKVEAVESLRHLCLPEKWSYQIEDPRYPNPILAKYLKWTFVKLMREDKILFAGKYAALNTGLVDKFYKPIYAVFDKNRYPKQEWHFIAFCVAGESSVAARILADNFSELPERAIYINKAEDVMYDYSRPVDVNWEHIILQNIDRMPIELINQVCSNGFEVKSVSIMNETEKKQYYASLTDFLKNSPIHLSVIAGMMVTALETAKARVAWNYKTAIPVYYPIDDKVHLILPLALNLSRPEEISLALVMTKMPSNRYRAVTIFTLDMAYSNARLVTKPSSDWLIAESINIA